MTASTRQESQLNSSSRSPEESVNAVVAAIQDWLNNGMCVKCSLNAVASLFMMDYDRVEQVWIDHNVAALDNETALD